MTANTRLQLDGATRLIVIVGDPIAQVKSPAGVSASLVVAGRNAICVPAHVSPQDLNVWMQGMAVQRNVDGLIITVPHKFAVRDFCATVSDRAAFLNAVNTLRRNRDGTWHGDMFDGLGYVEALRNQGCELHGRRALLVGAGGAGSAIAHALVMAGVRELAVHDPDQARRDGLIARLASLQRAVISVGSANPEGFDVAVNASPVGMQAGDPLPIQVDPLRPGQFVGCVITAPAITPLIQAARDRGCGTCTGADMFAQVRELMVNFLLEA